MYIQTYIQTDEGDEFEVHLDVQGDIHRGGSSSYNSDEPPWVDVMNLTYEWDDDYEKPDGLPADWASRVDDNPVASDYIELYED